MSVILTKNGDETYKPTNCFIKGKESICEQTFQVVFGGRTFDIPYSKVKHIWEDDFGKIQIELDSTIILDENTKPDEAFKFES